MTTTTPTLSTADLCLCIGQQVRIVNPEHISDGVITTLIGYRHEDDAFFVDMGAYGREKVSVADIRPILKPLSRLSEEEAKECFRLAFGEGRGQIKIITLGLHFGINGMHTIKNDEYKLNIIFDGRIECAFDSGRALHPAYFNAPAVIDYLTRQGYDVRGWIYKGLAEEKEE